MNKDRHFLNASMGLPNLLREPRSVYSIFDSEIITFFATIILISPLDHRTITQQLSDPDPVLSSPRHRHNHPS